MLQESSMSEDTVVWPGMVAIERKAAERAIRETREEWLRLFEECRAGLDADSVGLVELALIDAEIRRLRRLLGIKPDAEARRAATRERVRQHRERKRQGITLRESRPPETVESIMADLQGGLDFHRQNRQRRPGR